MIIIVRGGFKAVEAPERVVYHNSHWLYVTLNKLCVALLMNSQDIYYAELNILQLVARFIINLPLCNSFCFF